jgi:hypothetical protein
MADSPKLIFEQIISQCQGATGVWAIHRAKIFGGGLLITAKQWTDTQGTEIVGFSCITTSVSNAECFLASR